jgi:hypothetical protein
MANCAHFVAYSNILADPIGQAQFPQRHITKHNGLYLAHSILRNGLNPPSREVNCVVVLFKA